VGPVTGKKPIGTPLRRHCRHECLLYRNLPEPDGALFSKTVGGQASHRVTQTLFSLGLRGPVRHRDWIVAQQNIVVQFRGYPA
jgi:hypothetical protein